MQQPPSREIAILGYDSVNSVDVFGPMQVFTTANAVINEHQEAKHAAYTPLLLTQNQSTIRLSTGTQVISDKSFAQYRKNTIDTLVITGGNSARENSNNDKLLQGLKKLDQGTRRTVSVCTGAFMLAALGALDNRKATTHWRYAAEFQRRFTATQLDCDALFTQDGKYACSAGVTAGIDLALHLVQEDHGRRVALETAREMVAYYQRPGGQNQFTSVHGTQPCSSDALRQVQVWLHDNLRQKLDVGSLADKASMSVRHFSRKFSSETGLSPARYLALARLNNARVLLEEGHHSVSRVADLCGYGDAELMRRLFLKELNVTPSQYRKRFSIRHS